MAGSADMRRASSELAVRLPGALRPLARIAFNYRFAWRPSASALFARIDPARWERCNRNPVHLLEEVAPLRLEDLAGDAAFVAAIDAESDDLLAYLRPADPPPGLDASHPVAFFCAEFGLHPSLPIYSGGLGVLAGDILKEASDYGLPMVGVGIFYREGYCHQSIDASGYQREYYVPCDPERLPAATVSVPGEGEMRVVVRLHGREVSLRVWRVDVGRVPLLLLDSDVEENHLVDRWITARLYAVDRDIRLAQYAVLGIGGMRALRALGIEPGAIHLNEGHPAFAALELVREGVNAGIPLEEGLRVARERTIFTTHTPLAAGNETYGPAEVVQVVGDFRADSGMSMDDAHDNLGMTLNAFVPLAQANGDYSVGMTQLALRMSSRANGVSARHGAVARDMWAGMEQGRALGHVTNGVHVATWMAPEMAALLDRHLGSAWRRQPSDERAWAGVDRIPDSELWGVRCALRAGLIERARGRIAVDRLARGERLYLAEQAADGFSADHLVIGLARRLAPYKRTDLLLRDMARLRALLAAPTPAQILVSGKAHPADEWGKRVGQTVVASQAGPDATGRLAFLSDYDMRLAADLVAGADIWLNMPRPPLEASGTSGMKAALNGSLNLSILDGWWEEGWDGRNGNGWGIRSNDAVRDEERDQRDAEAIYTVLEQEVVPLFYERASDGVPHRWCARVKTSLRTHGPRFSATRMLEDYLAVYRELGTG